MKLKKILFLICTFFVGALFYGFYNSLIIIRFPSQHNLNNLKKINHKKTVNIFLWQDNKWHSEDTDVIWSENLSENIKNILTNWVLINHEFNQEIKKSFKRLNIQTVILDAEKKSAYISFDKNPLDKQSSIFQKIKLIESILKTISENNIKIQGIYFLVNHKFLEDPHLDFTHAWPVTGYTENN